MASSTPSSPPGELFASTVPYYAAFRPRYAPEFYTLLADRFGLDGTQRVLDLGAGPGIIALGLAPLVGEVIAVDPQKGMLEEGRRLATEHGITNITWREGDSTMLPALSIGPVLLTVLGAAYHWMDRDRVARDLDRIIEPGEAIVLASRGAPDDLEPAPWRQVVDEVRTRYLGPERRAGPGTCSHPEERHQDVLARFPVLPGRHRALGAHPDPHRGRGPRLGLQPLLLQPRPARSEEGRLRAGPARGAARLRPVRPVRRGDPHRGGHRHQALKVAGGSGASRPKWMSSMRMREQTLASPDAAGRPWTPIRAVAPVIPAATRADGGRLCPEISDTRAERRPAVTAPADPDAESGRGLLLVAALADAWGVTDRRFGPGKTVWAVVSTTSSSRPGALRQAPAGSSGVEPA